jgi:GATA-binding protein
MSCTIRYLPVTDLMSDHQLGSMNDRKRSTSPSRRRDEKYPLRTTLPSRQSSKENVEYPPGLQDPREEDSQHEGNLRATSRSPSYQNRQSGSPSMGKVPDNLFRAGSSEPGQKEGASSLAPSTSAQLEAIPSGQVCR